MTRRRQRVRRVAASVVLGLVFGVLVLAAIFPKLWRPVVASDFRSELTAGPVTESELRRSIESKRRIVVMEQSRFFGWSDLRSGYAKLNWVAGHAMPLPVLDNSPPQVLVALCYRDLYAAATGGPMTQFTLLVSANGEVIAWLESDW